MMGVFLLLLTPSDSPASPLNNVHHHDSYQLVGCMSWGHINPCLTVLNHSWYCSSSCFHGLVLLTVVVNAAFTQPYANSKRLRYHMSVGVCDCYYSLLLQESHFMEVCVQGACCWCY